MGIVFFTLLAFNLSIRNWLDATQIAINYAGIAKNVVETSCVGNGGVGGR